MYKTKKIASITILSILALVIGVFAMLLPAQNSKIINGAEPTTTTQHVGGGAKPNHN